MPLPKGFKHSEETRRKISEARKGKKHTEETKQKIGKANKLVKHPSGKNHPMWGKHHTKETREKITQSLLGKTGNKARRWKGGRIKHTEGYILIHQPNHPACQKDGYVPEHRLVMEKYLGRYLLGGEVIHHIGIKYPMNSRKNRSDNRLKNLILLTSDKEHKRIHHGWIKKDGKWFKPCSICQKLLEVNEDNWYFRKGGRVISPCKRCVNSDEAKEYRNQWYKKNKATKNAYGK